MPIYIQIPRLCQHVSNDCFVGFWNGFVLQEPREMERLVLVLILCKHAVAVEFSPKTPTDAFSYGGRIHVFIWVGRRHVGEGHPRVLSGE
jgi:hypothetical protein